MAPLIVLLSSFALAWLVNRFLLNNRYEISLLGRFAMAVMLIVTGIAHFINPEPMTAMIPNPIPCKTGIVYVSGVFEWVAAVGLISKKYARYTSLALILFFIAILPANIKGSIDRIPFGGMANGPSYLYFRIPLQLLFILWVYYFGYRIKPIK